MTQSGCENPIGVFDSGVGGLTILRAVRQALPCENLVYVAEPAAKPAVAATRSGVVGVLATPATLASARYRSLIKRVAASIQVVAQPCAGLAEHIERGDLDGERTEQLLRGFVESLLMELWAPHARLQRLPEFQSNAGPGFNATS